MGSGKLWLAMTPAAAESGTSSAADIARRSEKQSVGAREPQFVLGVVAQTANLQDRVREALVAKGSDWCSLADALGRTRQAVLASINRRHVQYSRLREIAGFLDVPTEKLLDKQWNCAANDEIL